VRRATSTQRYMSLVSWLLISPAVIYWHPLLLSRQPLSFSRWRLDALQIGFDTEHFTACLPGLFFWFWDCSPSSQNFK
jgi:hypothetical protein